MHHHQYVGHFDPRDPVNTDIRPYQPKVSRPLDRDAAVRLLGSSDPEIIDYVSYSEDGFVQCNWSSAPAKLQEPIIRFARALAEATAAYLMNERWVIEYPEDATPTPVAFPC